jgi:phosphoglycolate phosphatase-like HAD superfamily hydrolase
MSRKTIIFDFDGTIADSFDLAVSIFFDILHRTPITDVKQVSAYRRMSLQELIHELHVPKWLLPFLFMRGKHVMHKRIGEVGVFDGVEEVLRELHEAGCRLLIISSNSQKNVTTFLDTYHLLQYFDRVYGGVGLFGKTGALRRAIHADKLRNKDCYYVGDEVRDIEAARRARVKIVSVAWGYNDPVALQKHEPFAFVQKPKDLIPLLLDNE